MDLLNKRDNCWQPHYAAPAGPRHWILNNRSTNLAVRGTGAATTAATSSHYSSFLPRLFIMKFIENQLPCRTYAKFDTRVALRPLLLFYSPPATRRVKVPTLPSMIQLLPPELAQLTRINSLIQPSPSFAFPLFTHLFTHLFSTIAWAMARHRCRHLYARRRNTFPK